MASKIIKVLCPTCMTGMYRDDKYREGDVTTVEYICPDCGAGAVQKRVKGMVLRTTFFNLDGDKIKTIRGIDNESVLQCD